MPTPAPLNEALTYKNTHSPTIYWFARIQKPSEASSEHPHVQTPVCNPPPHHTHTHTHTHTHKQTFLRLSWFTFSPPRAVSGLTTRHSMLASHAVGPYTSVIATTSCSIHGFTSERNLFTSEILASMGWISSGRILEASRGPSATPTRIRRLVMRELWVKRRRWPLWRLSNVPPSAVSL